MQISYKKNDIIYIKSVKGLAFVPGSEHEVALVGKFKVLNTVKADPGGYRGDTPSAGLFPGEIYTTIKFTDRYQPAVLPSALDGSVQVIAEERPNDIPLGGMEANEASLIVWTNETRPISCGFLVLGDGGTLSDNEAVSIDCAVSSISNKVIINGVPIIDLTSDTATAENVTEGLIFHQANGEPAIGTYVPEPKEETITVTLTQTNWNGTSYTIPLTSYTKASVEAAKLTYPTNGTLDNAAVIEAAGLSGMGGESPDGSLEFIVSAIEAPLANVEIGISGLIKGS